MYHSHYGGEKTRIKKLERERRLQRVRADNGRAVNGTQLNKEKAGRRPASLLMVISAFRNIHQDVSKGQDSLKVECEYAFQSVSSPCIAPYLRAASRKCAAGLCMRKQLALHHLVSIEFTLGLSSAYYYVMFRLVPMIMTMMESAFSRSLSLLSIQPHPST